MRLSARKMRLRTARKPNRGLHRFNTTQMDTSRPRTSPHPQLSGSGQREEGGMHSIRSVSPRKRLFFTSRRSSERSVPHIPEKAPSEKQEQQEQLEQPSPPAPLFSTVSTTRRDVEGTKPWSDPLQEHILDPGAAFSPQKRKQSVDSSLSSALSADSSSEEPESKPGQTWSATRDVAGSHDDSEAEQPVASEDAEKPLGVSVAADTPSSFKGPFLPSPTAIQVPKLQLASMKTDYHTPVSKSSSSATDSKPLSVSGREKRASASISEVQEKPIVAPDDPEEEEGKGCTSGNDDGTKARFTFKEEPPENGDENEAFTTPLQHRSSWVDVVQSTSFPGTRWVGIETVRTVRRSETARDIVLPGTPRHSDDRFEEGQDSSGSYVAEEAGMNGQYGASGSYDGSIVYSSAEQPEGHPIPPLPRRQAPLPLGPGPGGRPVPGLRYTSPLSPASLQWKKKAVATAEVAEIRAQTAEKRARGVAVPEYMAARRSLSAPQPLASPQFDILSMKRYVW